MRVYELEGGDGYTRITPYLEDLPNPQHIQARQGINVRKERWE